MTIKLGEMQTRWYPDIGEVPEGTDVLCGVCLSRCLEFRNIMGPRSWVEAIGGMKRTPHDQFLCPYVSEKWHTQAEAILHESRRTPSAWLSGLLSKEAKDIMESKQCTKEQWG
jgi:hypothetical protein